MGGPGSKSSRTHVRLRLISSQSFSIITGTGAGSGALLVPTVMLAAAGAVATLARLAATRWLAPTATPVALAGTLCGLTVALRRGEAGDVAYRLALLATLVACDVLSGDVIDLPSVWPITKAEQRTARELLGGTELEVLVAGAGVDRRVVSRAVHRD